MASVTIEDVRKSYGSVEVLHGVDVSIDEGEFVVLVGPSGCGKSTLLRMLAGLEHITSGQILIGDKVVNDLPPKDRDIAMVFQNYALYPHLTVAENMGFSLKLAGVKRAEIEEKVRPAAEILGLAHLLDRYPRMLSGGQRQRVAMGRAIVRDPQVFLFDEPLSNLDAKLRVTMRSEIKNLHQRLKTTTVYVTHDQIEAMTMADKIVVMHDGIVEQIGTPLELYDRPDNLFVAGFIGSPAMTGSARAGQPLVYGVRPELMRTGGDIAMSVEVTEPTGAETHVVGHLGGTEITGVFRERITVQHGRTIPISIDPSGVHLFDEGSGQRVSG
jgi:multiple sugar transport system ATP-binding protein